MQPVSGRLRLIFLLSGCLALAVLLTLGTWQVQRLAWKERLIDTIEERVAEPPVTLSEVEAEFARTMDVDYRPVSVEGRFDHDRERHFLATFNGQSGWYVYVPLVLRDGRALWVNRGFVPYDRKDPASRADGRQEGDTVVTGLARNPVAEKPSSLLPDNDPDSNIFYWKDLGMMTLSVSLDPANVVGFFVDADDEPNPGGLPVGGVTLIELPNNHLQYAVTWYGLAAALVLVMGFWLLRREQTDPESSA